ncbi:MAG: cyclopropane fatty acyl phospholipid synthase [Proteobacteria bacterium]|jgi:cyclopropane-fatty-acyl-phospholipid synthase|nr:cyclopropane fatty acyl phospholipid synthase [Pseudomonadota bacterium]
MSSKDIVQRALHNSGIEVNGPREFDIQVHDERFYSRVLRQRFLGLGESYMDGQWSSRKLDLTCELLLRSGHSPANKLESLSILALQTMMNLQSKARSLMVIDQHYDIGNELFERMLDPRMVYTCAYWNSGAKNLAEAQEAKLDLVCRKLNLKPGMRVLDIGCGFGSFMKFASQNYGVSCVGYSLSKKQTELGKTLCQGLDVEFVLQDYREITGSFDAVASIGMFEAVGKKNFRTFMEVLKCSMTPEAISVLHTIGTNHSMPTANPWYDRYIFPNGIIPSAVDLTRAMDRLVLMNDWHAFGTNYDLTLLAWNENFQKSWSKLQEINPALYTTRFKRMWEFYLLSIAAGFRTRTIDLWQLVITHPKRPVADWRQS